MFKNLSKNYQLYNKLEKTKLRIYKKNMQKYIQWTKSMAFDFAFESSAIISKGKNDHFQWF